MNGNSAVRKEIHELIDAMPERNLYALRPLLDVLVDETDDDILTNEEKLLFEECQKDLIERPESFMSVAEYKNQRGLVTQR